MTAPAARLPLAYFDGRSARPQAVEAWVEQGELFVQTAAGPQRYPLKQVRWPERQRHGQRQAQLPDGGLLSGSDALAWDAWAAAAGLRESATVRWMQSWRHVGASLLLLIALIGAGWRWGVPLAGDAALRVIPPSVDEQIGGQTLAYFDRYLLKPSRLKPADQQRIGDHLQQALAQHRGAPLPAYRLHFREAGKGLGPNAFALPGGEIVLTDELVDLLGDAPEALNALVGVLAHELGHVQHRHGMRIAVQASVVGAMAGLIVGDFSSLLAGLPALLAQQSYSRDFERQADEQSRSLLREARISPRVMVRFFERIADYRREQAKQQKDEDDSLPIAFASHPADAERIRFFSE